MSSRSTLRAVSFFLLPALAIAFGILGYYTWLNTTQYARLGEQTIVQSLLLLAREKVDTVEQYVIDADNAVFDLVDPNVEKTVEESWRPAAKETTPSVRAVILLDENNKILADSVRGTARDRRKFLRVLRRRLLPELLFEDIQLTELQHVHKNLGGRNYLLAFSAFETESGRRIVLLHHDTRHLTREFFPTLFAVEEAQGLYNVVGENNKRVFGPDLSKAGEYVVGYRFPSTLYNWRLQVAPKEGAELEAQQKSKRLTEVALPLAALGVISLSLLFFLYVAAKERQVNQLKSDFIANVSHELKTPLSVIRMFAELLKSDRVQTDEKRQQYLEIISRESERLSALIDNVLDFSALERGRQTYVFRDVELREVIKRAREAFQYRADQDGNQIKFVSPMTPFPAAADEEALTLAVHNLLDNAVKYGENGPIELELKRVDGKAIVIVRDHGPGIPSDSHDRVFERFYREHRDNQTRGSGIGLALVKHIAEAHGGNVWTRNARGGGAEVGFSIPLATSVEAHV